jgi:hypothetical protein
VVKNSERHKQTRLLPTIIIYWSYYEVPMFLLQIIFAAQFEHWFNTAATVVAVVAHFAINIYSVKTIMPAKILDQERTKQLKGAAIDLRPELDHVFKHWAKDFLPFLSTLRKASLFYNHKLLRLLSSSYLGKPQY